MRRIAVVALLLGLLVVAAPAYAQSTYTGEGPVFGGELIQFDCGFGSEFISGEATFYARYGLPGQRLLGTYQYTSIVNAEGRTYGGEVTAPRRADYVFYTVMCTEPAPPPAELTTNTTVTLQPGEEEFVACTGGYWLDADTVYVSNPELAYTIGGTGIHFVNLTQQEQTAQVRFTCRLF